MSPRFRQAVGLETEWWFDEFSKGNMTRLCKAICHLYFSILLKYPISRSLFVDLSWPTRTCKCQIPPPLLELFSLKRYCMGVDTRFSSLYISRFQCTMILYMYFKKETEEGIKNKARMPPCLDLLINKKTIFRLIFLTSHTYVRGLGSGNGVGLRHRPGSTWNCNSITAPLYLLEGQSIPMPRT